VNSIFPVLVEEAGTGPNSSRFDLLLKYQAAPNAWAMATYNPASPGEIVVYLQSLGRRPSLAVGHEIVHDYLRGDLPIYVEEGMARLLSDNWVILDHGFVQYREAPIEAPQTFTTTHIADRII